MAIEEIEFEVEDVGIPRAVAAFLDEADRRIDEFRGDGSAMEFIPSDYGRVFGALQRIVDEDLASGVNFCEWGSGFGVVTGLAAMLEFESYGIEKNSELVKESRQLLEDFDLDVEFACGSFIPQGSQCIADTSNEFAWLDVNAGTAHEDLDMPTDEFDLIFAYPWPGEGELFERIFDLFGSVGALLLTYHGIDDLKLRRKVS